jgi:hypothetical protein
MLRPPVIDDKAIAVVDCEWRTAREIYAILDEGAFVTTSAALVRLAAAGRIERRHDPCRNMKVFRVHGAIPTWAAQTQNGESPAWGERGFLVKKRGRGDLALHG